MGPGRCQSYRALSCAEMVQREPGGSRKGIASICTGRGRVVVLPWCVVTKGTGLLTGLDLRASEPALQMHFGAASPGDPMGTGREGSVNTAASFNNVFRHGFSYIRDGLQERGGKKQEI